MRRALAPAFLAVACLSASLGAQSTSASLSGRVTDSSQAVIVDAMIAAISVETNLRHEATTGAAGEYHLTNLAPGPYRIEADKARFKKVIKPDVILHVQDALVLDFEMAPGQVAETVTVEAGAPLVNTTSATVGTVVDRTFVENLPLNGRSFQALITMTPGVVLTPATSVSPGQFSVNGQRPDANYFMVDGVSANIGVQPTSGLGPAGAGAAPGLSAQGGTNSLVSVDALQEFKIQSSTYAPEFGRTPGGQISIVTRSGTNQFRGSLFEYFRNSALDSADYFVKRQNLPKPEEQQHDFGGVFGGPINRDRMFVFVSYEGLRLNQPRSALTEVPSLSSRLAASDGVKPILTAFPLPNGPETTNGLAQFSTSYADPSKLNAASVRLDGSFGDALTIFGRYNYAPSEASSRFGSAASASANTIGHVQQNLQTLTAGATWIINPTVSNELRINWSHNFGTSFQTVDTFGGAVVPPAAMLHPPFAPSASDYRVIFGAANVMWDDGPLSANIQRQINIVDAVQMTKGHHLIKTGIDYRRLLPIYGPVGYVEVNVFNGVAGALGGTVAALTTAASSSANRASHGTNFAAFAQDTWSATPRLTLTYGMRWEVDPAPGLNDSDQAITLTTADPATMAIAPPGTAMFSTTYGNVAPRLGAAYRLRDIPGRETVLRGGWGIFYDLASPAVINNLSQTFPFTAVRSYGNVAFPADPAMLAPPTIVPGAPAGFLVAADPNLKLPYSHQWNLAVEQAFGSTATMSVSYVGALGRRLLRQEQLLNPTPRIQILTLGTNNGHSRYDSLQVKYSRRLSRGLQALASYTLANSRDNISNDSIPAVPSFRFDPDQDWGPSDFDVRHTFSGGVTYSIPASFASGWRSRLSRWFVDGVLVARSALPVNVVTGTSAFSVSNILRPDVVAGIPSTIDDPSLPGGWRFNRGAFVNPPLDANGNPLRQGTLGRNPLRAFAMSQVDLAVHRDIPVGRGMTVQFRAECFNVFNQDNFGPPANTLNSGLFGQATRTLASSYGSGGVVGGGLSPLYQVGGPRSIQLAVRFQF